jgi:hypothetical protein
MTSTAPSCAGEIRELERRLAAEEQPASRKARLLREVVTDDGSRDRRGLTESGHPAAEASARSCG